VVARSAFINQVDEEACVGCGLCGEVAHAAVLCPSFFEVKVVHNPNWLERFWFGLNRTLLRAFAGVAV
jgi:indolepyruvate ferredoxin oxidoreductase alpha subunit